MHSAKIKSVQEPDQKRFLLLGKSWSWLFLGLLIVFFSISGPGFLSFFNLQSIATDMALTLLMALGQTFVIISGKIDLSLGFVMGLASVVASLAVNLVGGSLPLPLAVLVGLGAGLGAGLLPGFLNGWIIARLPVPPFIVTLGMLGIARGVGFTLSPSGQPVSVAIDGPGELGNGNLLYFIPRLGISFFHTPSGLATAQLRSATGILPFQLLVLIIFVFICHWLLSRTRFGHYTYAIGGNKEAAARAGVPVERHTLQVYMLSAGLASIAGVLYMLRFTSGIASAGDALLLDSIASVAIGGASLFGGEGTIPGTVVGALIISVIQNGLVIMEVNPYLQFIAVGLVIILAVLVSNVKTRFFA